MIKSGLNRTLKIKINSLLYGHLKIELFFKQIRNKWFIYKQGQTIHNILYWYLIFFIFYDFTVMHVSK